jgi:hypothetical protein
MMLVIVNIELGQTQEAGFHLGHASRMRDTNGRDGRVLFLSSLEGLLRIKEGKEAAPALEMMRKNHRRVRLLANPIREVHSGLVLARALIILKRWQEAERFLTVNLELLSDTPTGEHMLGVISANLLDEIRSSSSS